MLHLEIRRNSISRRMAPNLMSLLLKLLAGGSRWNQLSIRIATVPASRLRRLTLRRPQSRTFYRRAGGQEGVFAKERFS